MPTRCVQKIALTINKTNTIDQQHQQSNRNIQKFRNVNKREWKISSMKILRANWKNYTLSSESTETSQSVISNIFLESRLVNILNNMHALLQQQQHQHNMSKKKS